MKATALLVDDDALTQELFSILLTAGGLDVVSAQTPAEARERIEAHRPNAILLDLNLAGADGLTLARELRSNLGPSIPLLVVSASSEAAVRQRAQEAGATGFIAKPVNPATFAQEVKKYLAQQASAIPVEIDSRELRLRELREQFLETALSAIEELAQRDDEALFADTLLADTAHKWVGASNIEGLPDVEETARQLESLAKAKRADQAGFVREQLRQLRSQFQKATAKAE